MSLQEQAVDLVVKYGLRFLGAVLIFIVGKRIINMVMKYVDNLSRKKLDSTLYSFVKPTAKILLYVLLLITVASTLGLQMSSFVAILGAAGLAVGLSLQGSLSNFAGGILILTFRPFNVGDFIEIEDVKGRVSSIQILYTRIITRDNKQVVIPNGNVSSTIVTNYTALNKRRVDLVFGVGYEADIDNVKSILEDIVKSHKLIDDEPAPIIRVSEHAESSINFNTFV